MNLTRLMSLTQGRPEIAIALIDGPVNTSLPEFAASVIRDISSGAGQRGSCNQSDSAACMHGTLVAGILTGRRESTPAICCNCTLLLRPIFLETSEDDHGIPASDPEALAAAIVEVSKAGARIINLSCGVRRCSTPGESALRSAVEFAANTGVIVVAAAGNQAAVGSSCITKHPWVIPVISIDALGRPADESNLGASIGRRGLAAPGQNVTSLSASGKPTPFSGTSVACPFVSGAAALLWSNFPHLGGSQIKAALTARGRPRTIVPPAMDACRAYETLQGASQ